MSKYLLVLVGTLAFSGCMPKYHPPVGPARSQESRILEESYDEIFSRARRALIRADFELQTDDRDAGVIDTGMLTIPVNAEIWDCGTIRGKPAGSDFVVGVNDLHAKVRVKFFFDRLDGSSTRVRVESRVYEVLARQYPQKETGSLMLSMSGIDNSLMASSRLRCTSSGKFEDAFFDFVIGGKDAQLAAIPTLMGYPSD